MFTVTKKGPSYFLGRYLYFLIHKMLKNIVGAKDGVYRGIYYWRTSSSHKKKIIFLHGYGDTSYSFLITSLFLKNKYEILCLDLPGFGQSFKDPALSYDFPSYAKYVHEFLEGLDLRDYYLVGNSLGGAIAAELCFQYTKLFSGLVLIDSATFFDPDQRSVFHEMLEGKNIFLIETRAEFKKFIKRVVYRNYFLKWPIREYLFHLFKKHSLWYDKLAGDFKGEVKDISDHINIEKMIFDKKIESIKCPIHLIWGEKDSLFPYQVAKDFQKKHSHVGLTSF